MTPPFTYFTAATELGISHWKVRTLVRRKKIKAVHHGYRTIRIEPEELENYKRKAKR